MVLRVMIGAPHDRAAGKRCSNGHGPEVLWQLEKLSCGAHYQLCLVVYVGTIVAVKTDMLIIPHLQIAYQKIKIRKRLIPEPFCGIGTGSWVMVNIGSNVI